MGFPLLILFGKGEATLILAAAWMASGSPPPGPWWLGAWLLAEVAWPALHRLLRESPWGGRSPAPAPSASPPLPYLQSGSPADIFLQSIPRLIGTITAHTRELPELRGALATALAALGIGIGLVGDIGVWLTLGVGVALLLARRLASSGIGEGIREWVSVTFPWWLGLAGGIPSEPALLAGIPMGLAGVGFLFPALQWIAWPLWVTWAVALGHGPGAYGLALIGLLSGEKPASRPRRARWILWTLALALTVWILRTFR
ncbi:hypothetical protein [Thermoflexus sp.]|uniref:hypothetical protein n=1 Tax=Thermoflexus sp. TaxID=1969742 RepID=UPI0025D8F099|nr:hypothetical protein [Thermoflexus sp.]MDW8181179.1 hypothetical protein [Anaerolineae bacterium]MCS6963125.1 hypothetical protein [Thermoflexus sp.]MCS7351721.1 hypothetical protein [Thermoflexus sp.]MCX7690482.1 hypothetical protein [Thermoflexus sp.]MDW8185145.1 hypothetical protein [Anaerolineae bacterium]